MHLSTILLIIVVAAAIIKAYWKTAIYVLLWLCGWNDRRKARTWHKNWPSTLEQSRNGNLYLEDHYCKEVATRLLGPAKACPHCQRKRNYENQNRN